MLNYYIGPWGSIDSSGFCIKYGESSGLYIPGFYTNGCEFNNFNHAYEFLQDFLSNKVHKVTKNKDDYQIECYGR